MEDVASEVSLEGGSKPKAPIVARAARNAARASAACDSASCTSRKGAIFSAARARLRSRAASASFTRASAERYSARACPSSRLVTSARIWLRRTRSPALACRRVTRACTGTPTSAYARSSTANSPSRVRRSPPGRASTWATVIRRSRSMPSSMRTVLASDAGLASAVCVSGDAGGFAWRSDPPPQLTTTAHAAETNSRFIVIAGFPRWSPDRSGLTLLPGASRGIESACRGSPAG